MEKLGQILSKGRGYYKITTCNHKSLKVVEL